MLKYAFEKIDFYLFVRLLFHSYFVFAYGLSVQSLGLNVNTEKKLLKVVRLKETILGVECTKRSAPEFIGFIGNDTVMR